MSTEARTRSYRADIDGLRAVAVLAVVAYHTFPGGLRGGYVGVDVFFAISGFLIGGLLLDEARANGRIDAWAFYRRRALRILPALLTVLAICFIAGIACLSGDRLRALDRHISAAAAFASNFVLWRESGYFDQGAQLKPLLHLWSLAIEEQFYLVAPLAIALLVRFTRRVSLGVLALAVVSFAVCATRSDATAAFYGPASRFWEIGAGVWTAAIVRAKPALMSGHRSEIGSWVGLLMVAVACARFASDGRVPVVANALPVTGACLLLLGQSSWVSRRMLGRPLLVFIGKISYPLYLWHWPLLSFHTLVTGDHPGPVEAFRLMTLASVLAVVTWRWVETPLRSGRLRSRNAIALASSLAVLGGTTLWLSTRGLPRPGSVGANDLRDMSWPVADADCLAELRLGATLGDRSRDSVFCTATAPLSEVDALLLGDSSANSLYPGFAAVMGERGVQVANIGLSSCAPVPGAKGHWSWNQDCEALNEAALAFTLSHPRVRWVYLGFVPWDFQNMDFDGVPSGAALRTRFDEEARRLLAEVTQLRAAGKTVVISYDVPSVGNGVDRCRDARAQAVRLSEAVEACTVSVGSSSDEARYVDWWNRALAGADACVFEQTDAFRDARGHIQLADDHGLVFRDDHHPTRHGSARLAEALARSPCAFAGVRF